MKKLGNQSTKLILTLGIVLMGIILATTVMFVPNATSANALNEFSNEQIVTTNSETPEENDFAGNLVTVTLTKEATIQFLNYAPADFIEVNAIAVKDLSAPVIEWVEKQVLGIPTEENMRINVEDFRRILSIELYIYCRYNVLDAVYILGKRNDICSAGPSYFQRKMSVVANDPMRGDLWGLDNINATAAWHITTGSSAVTVGVLDSGIQHNHPDLANRMHQGVPNHNIDTTLHRDFTTGVAAGVRVVNPIDPNGHGTHVAGTIGAQGNNGLGITGVAWDVRLVCLRVFNAQGSAPTHD